MRPVNGRGAEPAAQAPVALIDLLDRLLNGGAVLTGDIVLSIADVDLVHISLRAVIRSITADAPGPAIIPPRARTEEY
ncbi:gas vesicle protein [Streptomyces seoulensis]|uniref:Gas vesicle protein n=1 Tax=Streptomyces seoulensis TaxID=73044 RepID=A0A4P6U2C7_STRSO|nr:gas vesicle protein [Streptomyces seoulensis]QBJ93487.1 gas vesicle protein [Streptomyces seoulensis]